MDAEKLFKIDNEYQSLAWYKIQNPKGLNGIDEVINNLLQGTSSSIEVINIQPRWGCSIDLISRGLFVLKPFRFAGQYRDSL